MQDGLSLVQEAQIQGTISEIRRISEGNPAAAVAWDQRVLIARTAISTFDSTGFMQMPSRTEDCAFVISSLQRLAYHEADSGGVPDIAEWCMSQWLLLLQRNPEDLFALRGESLEYQSLGHLRRPYL